ncbi:hypothetical protein [Streptomyces sp. NPDC046805]|uniref:hypothetical protein n=1 Tax=Streptomyces sp. NPDC046805 TaxID=3155134 RepID=UPI0033FAB295
MNCAVELSPVFVAEAESRREAGFAAARGAVSLGEVDPAEVGFGNLGRPDGFLERQVGVWVRERDSYMEVSAIRARSSRAVGGRAVTRAEQATSFQDRPAAR